MRLLVVDEDVRSVPHICDDFRDLGHEVLQVVDWHMLRDSISTFRPEGIALDLMMPRIGIPATESSYTTGSYVYHNVLHPLCPGIPFVVFSAARLDVAIIKQATESLSRYPEFRGVLSKGCPSKSVIAQLTRSRGAV
jgi:CheY-like chemotaxis protein